VRAHVRADDVDHRTAAAGRDTGPVNGSPEPPVPNRATAGWDSRLTPKWTPRYESSVVSLGAHESRFRDLRLLGEGGMGVVYEAYDVVRKTPVALKTIHEAHGDSVYRLKREFRALAGIEHPNLVRLYDLFADEHSCFFTMELVRGRELGTWILANATAIDDNAATLNAFDALHAKLPAIVHVVDGLCAGLETLHSAGWLHRDLKPSNVLVGDDGRVVILDFGLVADAHASMQHTLAGSVAGTVAYMAPEQARGETELTTAVDRYALGAILFELLTGRLPFLGPPLMVLADKVGRDPKRVSELAASVPETIDASVSALLSRDPTKRPTLVEVGAAFGAGHAPQRTSTSSSSSSSTETARGVLGRDSELASVVRALESTASGRASVVLVRGKSGIGKSALLAAACREAESKHGAVVLAGRCYEFETVPFKGLDGAIDLLSRHLLTLSSMDLGTVLPPDLGDLAAMFPVLRRIGPIAAAHARRKNAERTPQQIRAAGFACLRELLRRIAEQRALVLAIDDVQWADEDTSRALIELLRDERAPSMLVLLGARPNDVAPVIQEVVRAKHAASLDVERLEIELAPLDEAATRALVRRELGLASSEDVLAHVVSASRGNPFAACELARFVRDGDATERSFDGQSIDAVIVERALRLDAPARALLDAIAIAGEPTAEDTLRKAAGVASDDRSITDALRARAWIRSVRSGASTLLDTVHDRIRESIVAAMPLDRRIALHRSIGFALEMSDTPPHDRLARHFGAAGERSLGHLHAVAAAEEAQTGLALRRAAEMFELALELAEPSDKAALVERLAEAQAAAGLFVASAETWERASIASSGAKSRELRRRAAEAWLYAGRIDHGLAMLEEVASELGVAMPKQRLFVVLRILWERLRLGIRGLRVELRPTSEIPERVLEELRTLRALALNYTPVDQIRGAAIMMRWYRRVLDAGHAEDLGVAAACDAIMAAFMGDSRRFEHSLALASDAGVHRTAAEHRGLSRLPLIVNEFFSGSFSLATEVGREVALLAEDPALQESTRSLVYYMVSACGNASQSFDARDVEAAARFARARETTAGPAAELRLRPAQVRYEILSGRAERCVRSADDGTWAEVGGGASVTRGVAYWFQSWAQLVTGEIDGALASSLEGERVMEEVMGFRIRILGPSRQIRLAPAALAAGDRALVRHCHRRMTPRDSSLGRTLASYYATLDAIAYGNQPIDAVARLSTTAREHSVPQYAAASEWALGHLRPGPEGSEHRARVIEMIRGSELIDPDRFFWSIIPIGEPPPRRHRFGLIWSDDAF